MFLEASLECQRVSCNCVVSLKSVKQLIYPQLSMVSHGSGNFREYLHLHYRPLPVVPHKAVAEVSKNRKPIREVGCCESGMAARSRWWTERWLRSPLFLSLSLTIYLPTSLSSMYLSIYRSISPSLSSDYLSIYLSISLSLSLSLSSCHLSICLAVDLSICLSTCLSVVQCHSV